MQSESAPVYNLGLGSRETAATYKDAIYAQVNATNDSSNAESPANSCAASSAAKKYLVMCCTDLLQGLALPAVIISSAGTQNVREIFCP